MKKVLPLLLMMLLSVSAFAYTPGAWAEEEAGTPFLKEFSVYPNPTTGLLTLTLETIDENRPQWISSPSCSERLQDGLERLGLRTVRGLVEDWFDWLQQQLPETGVLTQHRRH